MYFFSFKSPTYGCIFGSKGWNMTSKLEIQRQILAFWEGQFDNFQSLKPIFWPFWKLILSCLEIVYAIFLALKTKLVSVFTVRNVDI